MTWIKLDDNAVDHPKVDSLSDRAFRWWVKGLSYASRFLTDGVLPPVFWKKVPANDRKELTGNKLWDYIDPDMHIHDYLTHQSSKDDVQAEKQRNREKVAAFRERRKNERRNPVTGNSNQPVTGNTPDPCNRLVTDPENREQRTDTENREQRGSAPRPATPTLIARNENVNWDRRHGRHLTGFCDWVCLDEEQVREFAAKIPGDDTALKSTQIREWAKDIRIQWADRIVGDGSHFDFWRNRWTETHGGSRPANATLKAAKAASDLDEAFR